MKWSISWFYVTAVRSGACRTFGGTAAAGQDFSRPHRDRSPTMKLIPPRQPTANAPPGNLNDSDWSASFRKRAMVRMGRIQSAYGGLFHRVLSKLR
jgi:hypothetical protein